MENKKSNPTHTVEEIVSHLVQAMYLLHGMKTSERTARDRFCQIAITDFEAWVSHFLTSDEQV